MTDYKIPDDLVYDAYKRNLESKIYEDKETNTIFCISHDSIVKSVQVGFSWEWIQSKSNPSKNIRTRMTNISYANGDQSHAYSIKVRKLKLKHLHYHYESGFAVTQPGWITAKQFDLIPLRKNCFIFDLDGTITDTQTEFHARAECYVLKKFHNIKLKPKDISARFAGIPTRKVFKKLAPKCNADVLVEEKWKRMYQMGKRSAIETLSGMENLIQVLFANQVPISIATSSPQKWIELCLEEKIYSTTNLAKVFSGVCVSGEDCKKPKPNPEVFLKAQEAMFKLSKKNKSEFKTFVVGDGEADVLAGLAMKASVLYLSSDKSFDENPKVTRFTSSKILCQHILRNLL